MTCAGLKKWSADDQFRARMKARFVDVECGGVGGEHTVGLRDFVYFGEEAFLIDMLSKAASMMMSASSKPA